MAILSVIIPVYNSSDYLRQCLDSVSAQTLESLQVICIDDGSTDGSDKIIEEYAAEDPRFELVRQSNLGAGAARNRGILISTGKYIHFLDSDDWLEPDAYEKAVDILESTCCDSCFFQKYVYDNETGEETIDVHAFKDDDHITSFDINPRFFIRSPVVPWNKVTRRSVIARYGIRYDEIPCANDRTFYFDLIRRCRSIVVCREPLIHYRVNNSCSTVGTNRSIHYDAHFDAYRSTMSKHKDSPIEVRRMVADTCIADFFIFFDRAAPEYKESIYRQLHMFFKKEDLGFLQPWTSYPWGERAEYFRNRPRCPKAWLEEPPKEDAVQVSKHNPDFERPDKEVVASLTSFPARISTVHLTIQSILDQTVRPDRTVLWLAEEQFPGKESDLPAELLSLMDKGLEIRFCEDLKPHKKYFFAMQEAPDAIVITLDDDVEYMEDTVELLLKSYTMFPHAVSAMRVHRVSSTEKGLSPYGSWDYNDDTFYRNPSMAAMATGVGGVLYPPESIPKEAFDADAIKESCLMADDLWLKVNEVRNNVPTVLAAPNRPMRYIDGTQESALWKTNKTLGDNDRQLEGILKAIGRYESEEIVRRIRDVAIEARPSISLLIDCSAGVDADALEDLLAKMGRNHEIVCYDVPRSQFDGLFRTFSPRPNARILPAGKKKLPLYAVASVARGKLALLMRSKPLSVPGMEEAIDRRTLAESGLPALDDRLSMMLLSSGERTVSDKDVKTENYSTRLLAGMRRLLRGKTLLTEGDLGQAASDIVSHLNGGDSPMPYLDKSCVYDDSIFAATRRQCPVCGNIVDSFEPVGEKMRDDAMCRSCGSLERHRGLVSSGFVLSSGISMESILCVGFPSSVGKRLSSEGATAVGMDDIDRAHATYRLILLSASMSSHPDILPILRKLKSKLAKDGKLIISVQTKNEDCAYRIADTPYDMMELCSFIERQGFSARPLWNKNIFSEKTLGFRSILPRELVIECTIGAGASPRISDERAKAIGESYICGPVQDFDAALSWYDMADSRDEGVDAILSLGTGKAASKIMEVCSHIPEKYMEALAICQETSETDADSALTLARLAIYEGATPEEVTELVKQANAISSRPEESKKIILATGSQDAQKLLIDALTPSAEAGDVESMSLVSEACRSLPGNESLHDAYAWAKKAADAGHLQSRYRLIDLAEPKEALKVCESLAEEGRSNAMFRLACMHRDGIGTRPDLDKARSLMRRTSEHGSPEATDCLKRRYLGLDARTYVRNALAYWSVDEVEERCREMAANGFADALTRLGAELRNGEFVEKDLRRSARCLKASMAWEVPWAENELLKTLMDLGTPGSYVEMVARAYAMAKDGDAEAAMILGRAYSEGKGVTKDPEKAIEWMRMASGSGSNMGSRSYYESLWKAGTKGSLNELRTKIGDSQSPEACVYRARMLAHGRGLAKDVPAAMTEYRKASRGPQWMKEEFLDFLWSQRTEEALHEMLDIVEGPAEEGDPLSCLYLGRCYVYNRGKERDLDKACELLAVAERGKARGATNELIDALIKAGGEDNGAEAFRLASEYAEKGNIGSIGRLGRLKFLGIGTEKNLDEAYELMKKAADADIGWAKQELFDIIWEMDGNYDEMLSLVRKEAGSNQGSTFRLGKAIYYGKGVEKDEIAGAAMMRSACKNNGYWTKRLNKILSYEAS
ncbi:MAG: glycosyltransferase [Candidatus Methanomethylophilaceae archaeon]|nr:glycosyltransferase [Candidatus Methanomethylophilaceae archaeon]